MKPKIATNLAFAKNLFITGAFKETSRQVEIDICRHIPTGDNKIIVEFGIGHGNITREILRTMSKTSTLYAFEVNKNFCDYVNKSILDQRLYIINDGAQNIKKHLNVNIDAVISSIPFSFFSKEKGLGILKDTYSLMNDDSYLSQVLYTKYNFKKFQQIFEECSISSHKKTITEYIFHCKKLKKA
jgi:phospholipid N-methyltransferase